MSETGGFDGQVLQAAFKGGDSGPSRFDPITGRPL